MNEFAGLALFASLLVLPSACSPDRLQAVALEPSTLTLQLLAHWSFDDQNGIGLHFAHDDSGDAREPALVHPLDGQITGGSWLPDGKFGGALRLGDGEFVSVPRFPDVVSSFTVSAWVRLSSYSQQSTDKEWTTIISTESSGGWEVNVDHLQPNPLLHFGFWKGPSQSDYVSHSCSGLSLGVWTQIVGIVDPSTPPGSATFTVYVNGQQCVTMVTSSLIVHGSSTLTIGEWPPGGRYLIGDVDDISIWGRALVPAEVALLSEMSPVPSTSP